MSEDPSLATEKCYDANDPDIQLLGRFLSEKADAEAEEIKESAEEQYVKNADEEDDSAYRDFNNADIAARDIPKPISARNIQSARPAALGKLLELRTADKTETRTLARPMTVAAGKTRAKQRHTVRLRTVRSAGPGAFSVVGRPAKLSSRSRTATKKGEAQTRSAVMIGERNASAAGLKPAMTSEDFAADILQTQGLAYATTTTNGSSMMRSPGSITAENFFGANAMRTGTARQIDILTDRTIRPMSARVAAPSRTSYLQRTATSTMIQYVPTSCMRPFSAHKRPISAAVSTTAGARSGARTLQQIDPGRNRAQYLKYLRQLEVGARQFVIEEDSPKVPSPTKAKSLLQQAKKQRKHVRLKKRGVDKGEMMKTGECIAATGSNVHANTGSKEFVF